MQRLGDSLIKHDLPGWDIGCAAKHDRTPSSLDGAAASLLLRRMLQSRYAFESVGEAQRQIHCVAFSSISSRGDLAWPNGPRYDLFTFSSRLGRAWKVE